MASQKQIETAMKLSEDGWTWEKSTDSIGGPLLYIKGNDGLIILGDGSTIETCIHGVPIGISCSLCDAIQTSLRRRDLT